MITLDPPRGLPEDADPWRLLGLSRAGLSRFVRSAQQAVGLPGAVEILLADDRTLRRLNRIFLGKNKVTDVLSFPAPLHLGIPMANRHAGDLAISVETAARQADEHGHTLGQELRILLLHGLLHLHGMDHESDSGQMAARERELRARLRLPPGLIARAAAGPPSASRSRSVPTGSAKRPRVRSAQGRTQRSAARPA